jgi:hypothetical protein
MFQQTLGVPLPSVVKKDVFPAGPPQTIPEGRVGKQTPQDLGQLLCGRRIKKQRMLTVLDNRGNRFRPGSDHRFAAGEVFKQLDRGTVRVALRHETDIHGG